MKFTWHTAVLIAALVCLILATLGVPDLPRWKWGWAGLMLAALAMTFV